MPYSVNRRPGDSVKSDTALRELVAAIVSGDQARAALLLAASPELAATHFQAGATRKITRKYFLERIPRYIFAGDTALHIAAASYQTGLVRKLIEAGADVHGRNRLGDQPLHSASVGIPGSASWNPSAQSATILCLIRAGADPNATDKRGVTPLHRAVRTRCAAAVRTLLKCGADPMRKSKTGSTALFLAVRTTGRGGSGSAQAKAEQESIVQLLR